MPDEDIISAKKREVHTVFGMKNVLDYSFGISSGSLSPLLYCAVLMHRIAPRNVQMTVIVAGICAA